MDKFYQKLQAALDNRQHVGRLMKPLAPNTKVNKVDFSSNDSLAISSSGTLTKSLLRQLETHPNFIIGSRSSRVLDGEQDYMTEIEAYLAKFHGAEASLFCNSGFEANVALWSSLPLPGDFIVYDEYIHASIHDGMRKSRAKTASFRHNDCEDLARCLKAIRGENKAIESGENHVFVALESFYSMDGDLAPVEDFIRTIRDALPLGNHLISMDEAHSNGLVGPNGSGVVCHYGVEDQFPIRVHTCGKGLGSAGGKYMYFPIIIMSTETES